MRIGYFGFFILMITPYILLNKERLLLAAVFFAPFYECAVLEFSSFHLQPGHYFLLLCIFYYLISIFRNGGNRKIKKPNRLLLGFVIWAGISIIISALFRIDVQVYGIGNGIQLKSSLVSVQNFTQYLYLVLGFLLYWLFVDYCKRNRENFHKGIQTILYSGISVMLIGIYQLIAYKYGLPFVSIFRASTHEMWQQLNRVQATMGEASFLGQYCVWFLVVVLLGCNWRGKQAVKIALLVLVCFIGIRSRSSTFLVGMVVTCFFIILFQKKNARVIMGYVLTILLIAIAYNFLITNPYIQVLLTNTYNKFARSTTSGIQRTEIFLYMSSVGFNYILSGIGFGGGKSGDIFASILSTTGIIGFMLFFGFIISQMYENLISRNNIFNLCCGMLLISILVTGISVGEITYLVIWSIFAISDANIYLFNKGLNAF